MKFGGCAFGGQYSFSSRFEEGKGTNPDELISTAHAECFSMSLSGNLMKAGYVPKRVSTRANVRIEKVGDGFKITTIVLNTEVQAPGIDEKMFRELAEMAKKNRPVSQALTGVQVNLQAKLIA